MLKKVKDLMLPLSDYAVVDQDATILDALLALRASVNKLPPGRQPHRAILVQDERAEIIGKVHYFAFLRAFVPQPQSMAARNLLDRAGVGDDLRDTSIRMLDLLTTDMVDICERARHVAVRDVCTTTTISIRDDVPLLGAISKFLTHHTLSLLVTQGGKAVGILRLSDLFDELSQQITLGQCPDEKN